MDTPLDLVPKNEFFLRKYLQLTAEGIPLENLMDTAEDISMVDQPVIELEMLLDIDEDTVSDTDMDGASTFESLQTSLAAIPNQLDADDIGKISKHFPLSNRLSPISADSPMLKISAINQKIAVVSPGPNMVSKIGDTSFEQGLPLKSLHQMRSLI